MTTYNTISIKNKEKFIEYLNKLKISCLANPTYKTFNFNYKNSKKYEDINNSIVYIPSLANMNDNEIIYLAELINNYYNKNY